MMLYNIRWDRGISTRGLEPGAATPNQSDMKMISAPKKLANAGKALPWKQIHKRANRSKFKMRFRFNREFCNRFVTISPLFLGEKRIVTVCNRVFYKLQLINPHARSYWISGYKWLLVTNYERFVKNSGSSRLAWKDSILGPGSSGSTAVAAGSGDTERFRCSNRAEAE